MTPREAIPSSWTDHLQSGAVAIGLDLATTDKTTSNPSGLSVMEDYGGLLNERLVLAFKSADEAVTIAMVQCIFDDLQSAGKRVRACVIDATNETFFAQRLAKLFRKYCAVYLVKGSEKMEHAGETMIAKQLLGNLFANAHTDGQIASPAAAWIKDDRRLVKKIKGLFQTETNAVGQHGDTWDAGKLALWGLKKKGRVEASGVAVGSSPHGPARRGVLRPLAKFFNKLKRHSNA